MATKKKSKKKTTKKKAARKKAAPKKKLAKKKAVPKRIVPAKKAPAKKKSVRGKREIVDRVVFESFDPVIQELGKTQADLFFRWCNILISPDKQRLSVTEKGLMEYAGRLNRYVPALLTHLMELNILRSVETPETLRYEIARECYAPILRDWWERRESAIVARRRAIFRITSISVAVGAIAIVYLMWLVFSPK